MSRSHTHTLTLTLKHTNKIVRFFSFVLLLFCALFILCLSFPTHLHTVPVCLSPHPSVSPPVYLQTCLSPNVLTHSHTHTHTHTHTRTRTHHHTDTQTTTTHTHRHTHTHTHERMDTEGGRGLEVDRWGDRRVGRQTDRTLFL